MPTVPYTTFPSDPGGALLFNASVTDPSGASSPIVPASIASTNKINDIENQSAQYTMSAVTAGASSLTGIVTGAAAASSNTLPDLPFDISDSQDYGARFFGSDNLLAEEQPSDIAFFNIISATDYSQIIFPSTQFSLSKFPGVSNNKFRQFIVTNISHPQAERFQLYENNIDYTLNFFQGQKPEVLQISGILKNSQENPWDMNMLLLWDNLIRGGRLAELGLIMRMYIDGTTYLGYPIAFNKNKQAGSDFIVNFSMGFIIRKKIMSPAKNQQIKDIDNAIRGIVTNITKNAVFADSIFITAQ